MQAEVLIIGGGVAGCAAAIHLARGGRSVTIIEREPAPRHVVCGEFLSAEVLEELDSLGIDIFSLGAVPIHFVRLAGTGRVAEAALPFPAASLTRKTLSTALLSAAAGQGVHAMCGRGVESLHRTAASQWQITLNDGSIYEAPAVFLATGKHDLRGHPRPQPSRRWLAFKMYFQLSPSQTAQLTPATELILFRGGYAGLQCVEGGMANLCCAVQRQHLPGDENRWESLRTFLQQSCPHLAARLAGATALLPRPITISPIPYGFLRQHAEEGIYCIGDQAAVIPSFTGDGISIALRTAGAAAAALLAGESSPVFQQRLHHAMRMQMRYAGIAAGCLHHTLARLVLPHILHWGPGLARLSARLTRVTIPPARHTGNTLVT